MTIAYLAVQCSVPGQGNRDRRGTFLYSTVSGPGLAGAQGLELVSPVFQDQAELYAWAKANGFREVAGMGNLATYATAQLTTSK